MINIAVILAGGSGKRVGGDRPKQLLPLKDGRTVLQTAVDAFRACEEINDVVVVMHPDYVEEMSSLLSCPVIPGGKERWESSWNAIQYIAGSQLPNSQMVNILLHDAARPFVSEAIIRNVCKALEVHEAVTVAVPATDTIYEVTSASQDDGSASLCLCRIPARSSMMRAQTPQAFRLPLIQRAYEIAIQDPALQATDDCGIVHTYLPEVPICIVEGEEQNRKLTFKEDFAS